MSWDRNIFRDGCKKDVRLADGKAMLKAKMNELVLALLVAKVDGQEYEGMATVGDETRIRRQAVNPEDFDAFWTGAIAETRKQPLDPKMTLFSGKMHFCWECLSSSVSDTICRFPYIWHYQLSAKKTGKYPAVLQVPGGHTSL